MPYAKVLAEIRLMKKFTIEQFKNFIETNVNLFKFEEHHELVTDKEIECPTEDGFKSLTEKLFSAEKYATYEDLSITVSKGYSYVACDKSSFDATWPETPIEISGFTVVDEDGDYIGDSDLLDLLPDDFTEFDFSDVFEAFNE